MKKKTKVKLVAAALVVVVLLAVWLTHAVSHSSVNVGVDDSIDITPEQIESIKDIGEWEFLAIADEELADTTRKGFLSDRHLSRIYYGTLRLGIDMHQVEDGWITVSGDSITLTLPPVGLLDDDFIDEARTKSFHESGRWRGEDREALYQQARRQMLKHCLTKENLRKAEENGEAQVRRMMQSLGYQHVSIRFQQSHR